MSVRAESSRPSIPVRERPAYGDSDRAAGRDGSERSRRLGRREPRLAHPESPLTISRDGSCHTDLRVRGFLRAACLGFLVKATRRRRETPCCYRSLATRLISTAASAFGRGTPPWLPEQP